MMDIKSIKGKNTYEYLLQIEKGNDSKELIIDRYDLGNKFHINNFNKACKDIDNGICKLYVKMNNNLIKEQSRTLNSLKFLFTYYSKIEDVNNAERIYNIIVATAYICNQIGVNNYIPNSVFSTRDIYEIGMESKKVEMMNKKLAVSESVSMVR